ncbi:MAG: BNR-4 repeat-containing protein [Verrucomicrobiota bacterium JB024]|nr:BNR-4 repeat-containing protein [Verrucomicrobiota bacterium JB024]
MKIGYSLWSLVLLALTPFCVAAPVEPAAVSAPESGQAPAEVDAAFTKIATNATYGCRRPHGYGLYDPVVDKTFICWNGPGMSVMGMSYDNATGQWSPEKTICKLNYVGTWDYHNYPNMAMAPDGHLLITWADHNDNLQIARAPEPHSMEGEWSHQLIETRNDCYPIIFSVDGRVYIFYSVTGDRLWPYRSFGYVYSDDSGQTWSDHINAIDSDQKDPDHIDEVYAYHMSVQPADGDQPARVHFVWVMRGGPNGHNQGSRNAYMATFYPESGTWEAPDGSDLGEIIDLDEMLDYCTVLDTGSILAEKLVNRILVSEYSDGSLLVIYNNRSECWEAVWDGDTWQHRKLADIAAKDLEPMPDGSHRLLLSTEGQTAMEMYIQQEKGGEWVKTFEKVVPYADGADRTWSMAFIDHSRPEVDILMSQLKLGEEKNDYSGSWPVWTVDTSSAAIPVAEGDSLPVSQE